jgi:hypothetical protein
MVPGFQHTGDWYDFFGGNTINVSDVNASMSFQPGEYHVYFDQPIFAPENTVDVAEAMNLFGYQFMVYPNPADEQVTIGFNNTESQKVTIELLDLTGRLMEEIDSRNMPAGVQTFQWNSSRVEAGTYLVRIRSELFSDTHPLIIR